MSHILFNLQLPTKLASKLGIVFVLQIGISLAAEFECKGERIQKDSSTWGYTRSAGSDFRIEQGSATIGWIKKSGAYWRIETPGGSTLAWLRDFRIETPGGSTWVKLGEIKDLANCPTPVTAALWVLMQNQQAHD